MTSNAVHPFGRAAKAGAALLLALGLGTAMLPAASAMPGGGPHGHGMGGPMMQERMLDAVNASADQRTRIRDIFKAAGDEMRSQQTDRRALHEQMLQALAQPTVDAAQLEVLRQKQLAQHDQASRRMQQAMVDAANVLSPEQRKLLAEKMKQRHDMMERHQRERSALDAPARR